MQRMEDKVGKPPQSRYFPAERQICRRQISLGFVGMAEDGGTVESLAAPLLMQILLEQRTENHNRNISKTFGTSQHSSETGIQQPEQHHGLGKEPGSLDWSGWKCLELVGASPGIATRSFS